MSLRISALIAVTPGLLAASARDAHAQAFAPTNPATAAFPDVPDPVQPMPAAVPPGPTVPIVATREVPEDANWTGPPTNATLERRDLPPASVDVWKSRPVSLSFQAGIASPGGLIGIEFEYAPVRWLALGGGVGPTVMGTLEVGAQVGAWIAPRWVLSKHTALGFDLGVSGGPYETQAFLDEHGSWSRFAFATWFNAAARYQHLSDKGFSFRAFLGVANLLTPSSGVCGEGWDEEECSSVSLPYAGVAVGYAILTKAHGE